MDFKSILIKWYGHNARELPWRQTTDPYHIWVSEVILQQTRVAQGLSYYLRFINAFPTIKSLAQAPLDDLMKVWQGLGYYSRARNLQAGAQMVVERFNGKLPSTYDELITIKGLGPYSAGAIASFAFKQQVPAIDGNVYRILARIFGVFASPFTAGGKKEFHLLVMELMDKSAPDTFNQALLDFGALQCVPRSPSCSACPFVGICYAYRNNLIHQLPVKGKKIVPRDRFFNYIMVRHAGSTYINRREGSDIWNSLYEFPLVETDGMLEPEALMSLPEWAAVVGSNGVFVKYISEVFKHKLSHQTIYARFFIVEVSAIPYTLADNFTRIPIGNLSSISTPRLIDSFLAAEPASVYFHGQKGSS
ncbi:MAG: A/G-specific adenine glycosylase [Bacteroidales bacterium]|nr:A/G-specific adenine glycosylase [Bacteroidales bacterium]MBN2750440.1 A/G-specific adenine glycosylase [Bacteroidales bacterium]